MIACNFGSLEIVKILIDHGAVINEFDKYHFSPLIYAMKGGHFAISVYLLAKGA